MTTDSEKASILIVDDLPGNLLVYRTILEDLGQDLVLVKSGAEALKEVLQRNFAVIILDVHMQDLGGFETAALIRARKRSAHTPIIFVTAFPDESGRSEGYALGAVDFILSPVVPEILRTKIRVFVELYLLTARVRRQGEEDALLAQERVRRTAAEESNRRLSFLAEVGSVLGRSLNLEVTSGNVAKLAVPLLADAAAVVLIDPKGEPPRVILATANGEQVTLTESSRLEDLPPDLSHALTLGPVFPDAEALHSTAEETDNPTSIQAFALAARGDRFGMLLLSRAPSGRVFSSTDRFLVRAFASRSSSALMNARLFQDVQLADRRKEEFLPMLAHELRNPLGPIRNAVEILHLMKLPDAGSLRAVEIIDRQSTHLARLVDDLLDATRITHGKLLIRKEACDLNLIVRRSAEDYRADLEASGLRLDVELVDFPLWVEGDPTRLAQIVGNLLHNAHKFTDPGGVVTVEAGELSGRGQVAVRDTGIGIDRETLAHVFEVFCQGEQSLERSHGGLGLGLAVVKGLAELHGGDVTVASDGPGKGARFCVRLPLMEGPQFALRTPNSISSQPHQRILVVEDNLDAAESTRELLELMGHDVRVAYNGPDGLKTALKFRPHVALCDIGLPGGVTGYDLARMMREAKALSGMYLIALTGYGREEDQRHAQEAGFDRHLTKPVDSQLLRRTLASLRATDGS